MPKEDQYILLISLKQDCIAAGISHCHESKAKWQYRSTTRKQKNTRSVTYCKLRGVLTNTSIAICQSEAATAESLSKIET
jgi:hypothetical protein